MTSPGGVRRASCDAIEPFEAIGRREFVTVCVAAGAGLLLAGCAAMVTHPVPVTAGTVRLPLTGFPDLGKPDGAVRILPHGFSDPIVVLATTEGFTAISPICTHRGCTVDVQGRRLVCPCHGSTYDREGLVLRGPAQRALQRYPVVRDGDDILIDLRT